ncbi:MAG: hypothetical protein CBB97_13705 [Candidatus Endolissoclinum sp. TMED37]|nr:MAG: hypothetical protein CBB97_13705 [Candidatus Endolissoclinum sp. TMED37]
MENTTTANAREFKEKFKEKFKDFRNDSKKRKEVATKYTGLYTVQLANGDISFIGRWKSPNNKQKGITLGRKSKGMTPESAYALRLSVIDQEKKEFIKNLEDIHESSKSLPSETVSNPKELTLSEVFRKYLAFKKLMNGHPLKSQERLKRIFHSNFKKLKRLTPDQIDELKLRQLRYQLLSDGKAMKTIYLYLGLVRTLLIFSKKELDLKIQPINWKPLIPAPKELPKTTERLSDEEMASYLSALEEETPQVRNMFLLAIYTGMRKSELFRLKWDHIKWRKGFLRIIDPKSKDANERVLLTYGITNILKDQRELVEKSKFKDKKQGFVFYTPQGLRWKEKSRSIGIIYDRLRAKTGIEEFRMMHGLRHHFGSVHAAAGTPLPQLRQLMRHATTEMTMRYVTIRDEEQRRAAESIEQVVFKRNREQAERVNN